MPRSLWLRSSIFPSNGLNHRHPVETPRKAPAISVGEAPRLLFDGFPSTQTHSFVAGEYHMRSLAFYYARFKNDPEMLARPSRVVDQYDTARSGLSTASEIHATLLFYDADGREQLHVPYGFWVNKPTSSEELNPYASLLASGATLRPSERASVILFVCK